MMNSLGVYAPSKGCRSEHLWMEKSESRSPVPCMGEKGGWICNPSFHSVTA